MERKFTMADRDAPVSCFRVNLVAAETVFLCFLKRMKMAGSASGILAGPWVQFLLSCQKDGKNWLCLALEKSRRRGEMRALFKYLKVSPTEEGQDLFSVIPEYRTPQNGLKL